MLQATRAHMKQLFLKSTFIVLAGCATPQAESDPSPHHSSIKRGAVTTSIERPAENKNTRPKVLPKKRPAITGDATGSSDANWRLRGRAREIENKEICEFDANDLKLRGAERTLFMIGCMEREERATRDVQP
jgi:hypothetical protein